ncbi:MAG: helix-turn-helix domain-containing protein [Elusimicrobiota bacterium]
MGERIRYLRRRLRINYAAAAAGAGVSPNTLLRLERGEGRPQDWTISRLLRYLGRALKEVFPGAEDVYDLIIPPKDFGSWLRNLRLRRGLQQKELAEILGLSKVSVCRYEKNIVKPQEAILKRLRRRFSLNGEFERYI